MRRNQLRTEERRAYWLLVLSAAHLLVCRSFPTVFSRPKPHQLQRRTDLRRPGNQLCWTSALCADVQIYFWISLKNNIYIMLVSLFGQIPLGFLFAYVIHRKLVKQRDFFQTMIYLPSVISTIVIAILWQSFFSPYGPFTELVQKFIPNWENELFFDPHKAILPVLFVILWMYTGTYLIIFLANLQKIDPALIEAARIDGATEWQVLTRIILPCLSGVILTTAILAISGSLKSFDLVFAMTAGNPARRTSVLSLYMYDNAFRGAPNYPRANAISVSMVLLSLALIWIVQLTEERFGGREW